LDKQIVGEWRLVETRATDDDGHPVPSPYGPEPMGLLKFNTQGRMMAVLSDGRAVLPEGQSGREYVSYCGQYCFDGKTLRTAVDGTSDAGRIGGVQVRRVEFRGEMMVLFPPPRALGDVNQHRELIWEKILS